VKPVSAYGDMYLPCTHKWLFSYHSTSRHDGSQRREHFVGVSENGNGSPWAGANV